MRIRPEYSIEDLQSLIDKPIEYIPQYKDIAFDAIQVITGLKDAYEQAQTNHNNMCALLRAKTKSLKGKRRLDSLIAKIHANTTDNMYLRERIKKIYADYKQTADELIEAHRKIQLLEREKNTPIIENKLNTEGTNE